VALFPWLVAGEIHRIRGFFEARHEMRKGGGTGSPLNPALSRGERQKTA